MRRHGTAALGLLGLVVLVIGTFLPWMRSGAAERNSYRAGNALRRLLDVHGIAAAGLDLWPFVGLCCAVITAAYALGYARVAAVSAVVVAGGSMTVAIGALVAKGNSFVMHARPGPIVTILGASVALLAATVLLARPDRRVSGREHEPAT